MFQDNHSIPNYTIVRPIVNLLNDAAFNRNQNYEWKSTNEKLLLGTLCRNKFLRFWYRKNTIKLQKFPPLKLTWFKKTDTCMIDIPKSLLLQHHLAVLEIIGYWTKWKTQNKLKRKTLSEERLYASIKNLPKRFLSAAMVADFSFELIATFTAMCLNFDRLFFCKGQKHLISSRPTISTYSRTFCTVSDASTPEDI